MFNEETLAIAIRKQWGSYGSHMEVFQELLRRARQQLSPSGLRFWEVGYKNDEATFFCFADNEIAATKRYIDRLREIEWLNEELDLEKNGLWVKDRSEHWMGDENMSINAAGPRDKKQQ